MVVSLRCAYANISPTCIPTVPFHTYALHTLCNNKIHNIVIITIINLPDYVGPSDFRCRLFAYIGRTSLVYIEFVAALSWWERRNAFGNCCERICDAADSFEWQMVEWTINCVWYRTCVCKHLFSVVVVVVQYLTNGRNSNYTFNAC